MGIRLSEQNKCVNCKIVKERALSLLPIGSGDDSDIEAHIEVLYEVCRGCKNVSFLSHKEELVDENGVDLPKESKNKSGYHVDENRVCF